MLQQLMCHCLVSIVGSYFTVLGQLGYPPTPQVGLALARVSANVLLRVPHILVSELLLLL